MKKVHVSVAIITLYWVYQFFFPGDQEVPDTMMELFLQVMKVKLITLLIIYLLIKFEGSKFSELGFENTTARKIWVGSLFGIGVFIIANILFSSILDSVNPSGNTTNSQLFSLLSNSANLPVFLFLGIFGGGFVEEIQRIFVLTRFEKVGKLPGLLIALIISTVVFGLGHLYQGINSVFVTGLTGLLFGLVYLRKRSAIEAITCHAVFDIIGIILAYFIYR